MQLLEYAAITFTNLLDAAAHVECSFGIQNILKELLGKKGCDTDDIWDALSTQCRESLSLLRESNFTLNEDDCSLSQKR